jgi:uncharacterized protein YigA (DUF484 family)
MGRVVSFDSMAMARLRDRLGVAESARADLVAFARGHSAAVASIHDAVLDVMDADGLDSLMRIVSGEWAWTLGVDCVALVLVGEGGAQWAVDGAVRPLSPAIAERAISQAGEPILRQVERGLPLFGECSTDLRVEALVPVCDASGAVLGLLLLGQREPVDWDGGHGLDLLMFLGRSLGAMVARWTRPPTSMDILLAR